MAYSMLAAYMLRTHLSRTTEGYIALISAFALVMSLVIYLCLENFASNGFLLIKRVCLSIAALAVIIAMVFVLAYIFGVL